MLSERLKIIAGQIEKGQTMADIGTDHGFLPLYLWENDICPKIIMTDISAGSLNKAKETFEKYAQKHVKKYAEKHAEKYADIHFRPGDGLGPVGKGEAGAVVIAGMGGVMITRILGSDISKTLSFEKYILQPRNGSGKLRYWLEEAKFETVSEHLAEEGKFICEIITASPPESLDAPPSLAGYPDRPEYEIPRRPAAGNEEIFELYLNKKLNIEKEILKEMINGKARDEKKISRVKSRIKFLEGVLLR